ncbi:hypothetical protein K504DRAFT_537569 [Pleomassaria siparia CBS 279.74]|uniref:Leucine-rich repeat domain-containing protein n=1 Tax=Pleomassaria siparia CBS 279.74 TaxID=1314801 RepID=A0A6G1JWM0_9PLEO|nr:hypothetical protein K504DRAFT_537569 [Pleomassaria siparia CBS 279.74]
MATLSDIPAEIKLCIAEALHPDDCFSFAMINQDFWQLLESTIKNHKALYAKYGYIYTIDYSYMEIVEHTLWNLLNDILDKPRIAEYVVEVQLDHTRGGVYDDDSSTLRFDTAKPPHVDVVRWIQAADDNPFLHGPVQSVQGRMETKADMHEQIEYGSEDVIITIILSLLPHLKTLRFVPLGGDGWFRHALQHIGLAYARAGHQHVNPGPTPPWLPFQHLTKASISHCDTELCIDWTWVVFFTRLPSLEYFSGHMVGRDLDEEVTRHEASWREVQPTYGPQSNVASIAFSMSCIGARAQDVIFSNFKCLKQLDYENGGAIIDYADYTPRRMMASLVRHCSHSLERLVLQDESSVGDDEQDEQDVNRISFPSGLEKLKTLRCTLYNLVVDDAIDDTDALEQGFYTADDGKQEDAGFDPRKVLPPSLEGLHVDGVPNEEAFSVLEALVEAKRDHLTNLSQVYISLGAAQGEKLERLKERAIEGGFKFEPIFMKTKDIYVADID